MISMAYVRTLPGVQQMANKRNVIAKRIEHGGFVITTRQQPDSRWIATIRKADGSA
jgi:hypothetical protein